MTGFPDDWVRKLLAPLDTRNGKKAFRAFERQLDSLVDVKAFEVLGKCEPCDRLLDGTAMRHLTEAHADEMYEAYSDPQSGTWTILRRAREFEEGRDV